MQIREAMHLGLFSQGLTQFKPMQRINHCRPNPQTKTKGGHRRTYRSKRHILKDVQRSKPVSQKA
jgi:hypothetical protein